MPGLDGLQTLDALRALNPQILACLMNDNQSAADPEVLRQCGAAVVAKPFYLDDLADTLWLMVRCMPAGSPRLGE
jgi:CheY-like chemotaxis protein